MLVLLWMSARRTLAMSEEIGPDFEGQRPVLSDRQLAVHAKLCQIDASLGDRYLGMHWAIQSRGPDRWSQSANSARELIKDLLRYEGGESVADVPTVSDARSSLRDAWGEFRARAGIPPGKTTELSQKPIDKRLAKVLAKLEVFYRSLEAHKPKREDQIRKAIAPLDLVDVYLPSGLVDEAVEELKELWTLMEKATHHGRSNSEVEADIDRLDAFFARWVPETFSDLDAIDAVIADPSEFEKAMELVSKNRVNRTYFFEHLNEPGWIDPLAEAGFFSEPPARSEDAGRVSYPGWPEGEYLLRMIEREPEKVVGIVGDLTDTDNVRVRSLLIRIALAYPPSAKQRAALETAWLESTDWIWFDYPDQAAELAVQLADAGDCEAAIGLFHQLMEVRSNGETGPLRARAILKFDDWYFEQICERIVPRLVESCGENVLNELIDLLEQFIAIEVGNDGRDDYSTIWRPDMASSQFLNRERDQLLDALRSGILQWVGDDPDRLRAIVANLADRPRNVFLRLALSVLSENASLDADLALRYASDAELSPKSEFQRELDLLRRSLSLAGGGVVPDEVLARIDEGPDWPPEDSDDYTAAERDELIRRWKAERLTAVQEHLPPERVEERIALVAEFGEPDLHRDRVEVATYGVESPLTPEEVNEKSASELVDFAAEWQPPAHFGPSRFGLARPFTQRLMSDPEGFADEMERIAVLPPEYVREILAQIEKAVRDDEELKLGWPMVFEIAESILKADGPLADGQLDVLASAAATLEVGLYKELISDQDLDRTLAIVRGTVERSIDASPEEGPTATGASGVVSPLAKATQALLAFAWWQKKKSGQNLSEQQEVADLINQLLALDDRRYLFAREALGTNLGTLFSLDKEWFKTNLDRIFPGDAPEFRDALWISYLKWSRPYSDMMEPLKDQYARSIGELENEGDDQIEIPVVLAQHLGSFYWWDLIGIEDDGLVQTFIQRAPDRAVQRLFEFLGHSLDESEVDETLAKRLPELWDVAAPILLTRPAESFREVAAPFGWWWGSGKLETAWADEQFRALLQLGVKLDPEFRVFTELEKRSESDPAAAVLLLRDYVRANPGSWRLQSGRSEVRSVLRRGLESEDGEVIENAKGTINELGALGLLEYRDLID